MLIYFLTNAKDLLFIQYIFFILVLDRIIKFYNQPWKKNRKMFEMFGEDAPQFLFNFKRAQMSTVY